jgi:hypothetical protein
MLKSLGKKRTLCLFLYNIEVIFIILHVCMCVVGRSVEGTFTTCVYMYMYSMFFVFLEGKYFLRKRVFAPLCGSSFYGVSKESTV